MVEDYGMRLTTAMHARGVSAQQLAAYLGVSYQAVRKVLRGESTALTAFNNSRASRFLEISSDWLATGDGLMENTASGKGVASFDSSLHRDWDAASEEAKEVARFALSATHAPLPAWADKDMRRDINSMRYAALCWLREDRQRQAPEPKKIAAQAGAG